MFLLFIAATVVLAHVVIDLVEQRNEQRATIQILSQDMSHMEKKIEGLERDNEEMALLRFKDNILKLKYPALSRIARIVFEKSQKYNFNPFLIMAIIQVESNFDPYAVSAAGAYGLMQVNYSVWKDELGIDFSRIFDKGYNIELGLKILKHYYNATGGNIFKTLFHYNNGYKYNNTEYNGRVISTIFYANKNKAAKDLKNKDKSAI